MTIGKLVRRLAWLGGVLAVCGSAHAQTQTPAPTPSSQTAPVAAGDLIGLDPQTVRTRLAGLPADWPVRMTFKLQGRDGVLAFTTLYDLLIDPAYVDQEARFDSGDFYHAMPPHIICHVAMDGSEGSSDVVLMFRDNRLAAMYADARPAKTRNAPWDVAAYVDQPGDLPLSDGDGLLTRWPLTAVPASAQVSARCAPWQAPPAPAKTSGGDFDADWMLIPLAPLEPVINAGRDADRKSGSATLGRLQIGQSLGQSPEAFASNTSGVRVFRGNDPKRDYAVLTINMGAWPSNHLDNTNDTAMVGVTNGVVTWIVPSVWRTRYVFGLSPRLLCLDAQAAVDTQRPGCHANGDYTP